VLVFLYSAQVQDVGYYGVMAAVFFSGNVMADTNIVSCGNGSSIPIYGAISSCNCPSGYVLVSFNATCSANGDDGYRKPNIAQTGLSCPYNTYLISPLTLIPNLICAKVCQ
jgi:hypothetical protein